MRLILIMSCLLLLLPAIGVSADKQVTTLDNGLRVIIVENHQVPQVNISTTIKVGAKNESDYFDGATHLLEHLILFRGTENMTGAEVGNAMNEHGAYFNGYTSADWTDFVISLPSEYLDFALQIHADMLFRSNFPKAEMDDERHAVLEEINISEDSPAAKVYRASLKELYGSKHAYSKNVLGTKQNVENVSRDSLYAYYKRYYAPNNMTTVIVGDIDPVATLELVKKYFAAFPKGEVPVDNHGTPPSRKKIESIQIKKDVGQGYLFMGSIGPDINSPDQFTLDIMATILGDGESSRLWKKLKDEDGLVYSVGYSFETRRYEGIVYASAELDPANISAAEKAINEVLNDAKANGFTEHELQKAKNQIKTSYYVSMERGLNVADRYAQYDAYQSYKFIDDYPANIEKVTLAELNAATRKYLNTDSYVKTTVVPK